MNRNAILGILAASTLTLSGVATAQSTTPTDPSTTPPPQEKTTPPATTPVPESSVQPSGTTTEGAAAVKTDEAKPQDAAVKQDASAKPPASMDAIKEKGKTLSAKERQSTDTDIAVEVKKVNAEATAKGETTVATRLGEEFGVSADGLVAEKAHFKTGWGDLMIGHTLLANASTSMTLQQIFDLRQGGMGWGEIAHGMDLRIGELVSAVQAESRVATGLSKPDGKVETVSHGVAARTTTQASTKASTKGQPQVRANVGAGAGVGAGLGHTKAGK